MQKYRLGLAVLCFLTLLLSVAVAQTPAASANFSGTWQMTMTGGGEGGGGGQGGGGGHHGGGGGGTQTLTITQSGDKYKVTHKTRRGDINSDATVSGNTISWTEVREGREGNSMKIEFKATLDGDTIKGSMGGGQFNRDFTAKRSNPS
ncbi:MAG: hypothetical protein WB780_11000 [Candidatus Acidiferrales bacterium]